MRNRHFLIAEILLVTAACAGRAQAEKLRVFVVAGQSNAVGHNHTNQYHGGRQPFPAEYACQPKVRFWPGVEGWKQGENRWTELRVSASGAFGPEVSFAQKLHQELPQKRFAVIKFAVDASGIARSVDYTDYIPSLKGFDDKGRNWRPPTQGSEAGLLYRDLIANVRGALTILKREGESVQLMGFVWMQGEHEGGISRRMAEDYSKLLPQFITSVRQDLAAPHLPFVVGQVNSHAWAFGDVVRASQEEACRAVPGTFLVKTTDLARDPDPAHFNADGTVELGLRFAKASLQLIRFDREE